MTQSAAPCACQAGNNQLTVSLPSDPKAVAAVFKAMGHPTRLALIEALREGERCVCDLAELVPGEISTVSRHLMFLKTAGIIDDRREGKRVYYHLKLECVTSFVTCIGVRLGERE